MRTPQLTHVLLIVIFCFTILFAKSTADELPTTWLTPAPECASTFSSRFFTIRWFAYAGATEVAKALDDVMSPSPTEPLQQRTQAIITRIFLSYGLNVRIVWGGFYSGCPSVQNTANDAFSIMHCNPLSNAQQYQLQMSPDISSQAAICGNQNGAVTLKYDLAKYFFSQTAPEDSTYTDIVKQIVDGLVKAYRLNNVEQCTTVASTVSSFHTAELKSCIPQLSQPTCGDGIIQAGEQCDFNNIYPLLQSSSATSNAFEACNPNTCQFKQGYLPTYLNNGSSYTPAEIATPETQTIICNEICGVYTKTLAEPGCTGPSGPLTPNVCWAFVKNPFSQQSFNCIGTRCHSPISWFVFPINATTPFPTTGTTTATGYAIQSAGEESIWSNIFYLPTNSASMSTTDWTLLPTTTYTISNGPTSETGICTDGSITFSYQRRRVRCAATKSSNSAEIAIFPDSQCNAQVYPAKYRLINQSQYLPRCTYLSWYDYSPRTAANPDLPALTAANFTQYRRGFRDTDTVIALQPPSLTSAELCTAQYVREYSCMRITAFARIFVQMYECTNYVPVPADVIGNWVSGNPDYFTRRRIIWESRCTPLYRCESSSIAPSLGLNTADCAAELTLCQNASTCSVEIPFTAICSVNFGSNWYQALPRLGHDFCATAPLLMPSVSQPVDTSIPGMAIGHLPCTALLKTSNCFNHAAFINNQLYPYEVVTAEISAADSTGVTQTFGNVSTLCTFEANSCDLGTLNVPSKCSRLTADGLGLEEVPAEGCDEVPEISCYYPCPESLLDVKCKMELDDSQPGGLTKAQMSTLLMNELGFNVDLLIESPAFCGTIPTIPGFCGQINWKRTKACYSKGTNEPYEPCSGTDPVVLPTVPYTSGCVTRCYDGQALDTDGVSNKYLFDCSDNSNSSVLGSSNIFSSSSCRTGSQDTTPCKSHIQTILPLCQFRNSLSQYKNVIDPTFSGCKLAAAIKSKLPSGQTSLISTPTIIKTPCWRANSVFSMNQFNIQSKAGRAITDTAAGSECSFTHQCKFTYDNYNGVPNMLTLPTVTEGQLSTYNTAFCGDYTFPCDNNTLCGTISQSSRCVVRKPDGEIVDVLSESLFPTTPTTPDEFAVSDRKLLLQLCDISQTGTVNEIVTQNVCTQTKFNQCFEVSCSLPTDYSNPTDSYAEYTTSLCSPDSWNNFCLNSQEKGYCGDKLLALRKKCYDKRAASFLSTGSIRETQCLSEAGLGAEMSAKCSNYSECKLISQFCNWQTDATGFLLKDSEDNTLCERAANPEFTCESENLCGPASLTTGCIIRDNLDPDSPEQALPASICEQVFDIEEFKPLPTAGVHCTNYNRCSSWACSATSTTKLMLSQLSSIPRSSYDGTTGAITSQQCIIPLAESSCSSLCGTGVVSRTIGCLRRVTSDYAKEPSFSFYPDATTCGDPIRTLGATIAPIAALPCNGDSCGFKQHCAFLNTEFSTTSCTANVLGCLPTPGVSVSINVVPDPALPTVTREELVTSPILDTTFTYQFNTVCTAQNGTLVELANCATKIGFGSDMSTILASATCPYQPSGAFCANNLQTTLDFTTGSAVFGTAQTDPLSLTTRYGDSRCDQSVSISGGALFKVAQGGMISGLSAVKAGDVIRVTSSYVGPAGAQLYIYLMPLDNIERITTQITVESPTGSTSVDYTYFKSNYHYEIMPYLAATLSTSTPSQTFTLQSFIPPGNYSIALYIDKLTFQIITSTNMTIVPTAANESDFSTSSIYESDLSTSAVMMPTAISCSSDCYNGYCDDKTDPAAPKCVCFAGFFGDNCLQSEIACTVTPSQLSSTICNPVNGIASAKFADTPYFSSLTGPNAEQVPCDRCICRNGWDSTDGCNTCVLQCGEKGEADPTCSRCTCAPGYSGIQCTSYTTQFSLQYHLAPSFLEYLYQNGKDFDKLGPIEEAQLINWKRMLISDVSSDLRISTSALTIEQFGSSDGLFTVIFAVTFSAPYKNQYTGSSFAEGFSLAQSTNPTTPKEIKEWAAKQQMLDLRAQIATFNSNFAIYRAILAANAPKTYIELPSFNYTTLLARYKKKSSATSVTPISTINALDQGDHDDHDHDDVDFEDEFHGAIEFYKKLIQQPTEYQSLLESAPQLFSVLSTEDPTALSSLLYKQSQLATSPLSDASGGFAAVGQVYDASSCSNPSCQPPTLAQSAPARRSTPETKEIPVGLIVGVILGVFFLTMLIISILCCIGWMKQIWCWRDFLKRKKEEEERKRAEKRRTKGQQPQGSGFTPFSGTNSTESHSSGSSTPGQTMTTAAIPMTEARPGPHHIQIHHANMPPTYSSQSNNQSIHTNHYSPQPQPRPRSMSKGRPHSKTPQNRPTRSPSLTPRNSAQQPSPPSSQSDQSPTQTAATIATEVEPNTRTPVSMLTVHIQEGDEQCDDMSPTSTTPHLQLSTTSSQHQTPVSGSLRERRDQSRANKQSSKSGALRRPQPPSSPTSSMYTPRSRTNMLRQPDTSKSDTNYTSGW